MPLGFIANAPILCAVTNLSLRRALALDRTPWVVGWYRNRSRSMPRWTKSIHGSRIPRICPHFRARKERTTHKQLVPLDGHGPRRHLGQLRDNHGGDSQRSDRLAQRAGWRRDRCRIREVLAERRRQRHIPHLFTYNPAAQGDWSRDRTPVRRSPKHVLDDMARLRSVFEHGKSRVHSHRLTTEEMEREIGLQQSDKNPGEAAKVVRLHRRDAK